MCVLTSFIENNFWGTVHMCKGWGWWDKMEETWVPV